MAAPTELSQYNPNALIVSESGSVKVKSPVSAFVEKNVAVNGSSIPLELASPFGRFWNDYTQTGAITFTVGGKSTTGGTDRIKVAANGSAINFDTAYTWVNINATSVSVVNGTSNIFYFIKVSDTRVEYTVTVTTP